MKKPFFQITRDAPGPGPTLIGVEGLDGSGKTVQANRLCSVLRAEGKRACVIDFPQYSGFFGREVGRLLSGKEGASAMELDVKSMCLWYALDRWKTLGNIDLQSFDSVIFNRYTLSNVVYQCARTCQKLDRELAGWIFELEHVQLGLPRPDLYLFLDTRAELTGGNVLQKEGRDYVDGLDVYESSVDLQACCRGIYRELAAESPGIQILDCMDSAGRLRGVDEIGAELAQRVRAGGLRPV